MLELHSTDSSRQPLLTYSDKTKRYVQNVIDTFIATSNKDACDGLPGNTLKNLLRNPLCNNTAHDN